MKPRGEGVCRPRFRAVVRDRLQEAAAPEARFDKSTAQAQEMKEGALRVL